LPAQYRIVSSPRDSLPTGASFGRRGVGHDHAVFEAKVLDVAPAQLEGEIQCIAQLITSTKNDKPAIGTAPEQASGTR
jgi:hypothetical protein